MSKWPSKKELDKVLKKLESAEGTKHLAPNASPLEKFRWELQQQFVKYKRKSKINQRQMADLLGVDESKVSKILHHRLEEFSTDRLINLLEKIDPDIRLKVG